MNELSMRSFGTMTKEQITKFGVAKALMSSGNATNVGDAFRIIEGRGNTVPLVSESNTEYKTMIENIAPADQYNARVNFSTLKSIAGLDEVTARELTEKAYGYTQIQSDGLTASLRTNNANYSVGQRFGQAEIPTYDKLKLNMHNAENVRMSNSMLELMTTPEMGLQSPETFYYMLSNETVVNPLGEEARQQITTITAKTNPRITYENNVLTVTNDEGDRYTKFLSNEQMKSIVNDSNDFYRETNPPTAWSKISGDFATGTYNFFQAIGEGMVQVGEGPQGGYNVEQSYNTFINNLDILKDTLTKPKQWYEK